MPLNDRKIISIILEQCDQLEERCEGYREEITAAIADIIQYERLHRVQATTIQQKISDKCNAVGSFLARHSGDDSTSEE